MSERRQSASNRCMQRATHQIGHLIIFFASFFYSWFVSGVVSFLLLCFAFESCRDAVNITHVSCTAVFLQSCAAFKLRSFFIYISDSFVSIFLFIFIIYILYEGFNQSFRLMYEFESVDMNWSEWKGEWVSERKGEMEKILEMCCTPFSISCSHTLARYRSRFQTKIFEHRMANSSQLFRFCGTDCAVNAAAYQCTWTWRFPSTINNE